MDADEQIKHLVAQRNAVLAELHDIEDRKRHLEGAMLPRLEGGIEVLRTLKEERGQESETDPTR